MRSKKFSGVYVLALEMCTLARDYQKGTFAGLSTPYRLGIVTVASHAKKRTLIIYKLDGRVGGSIEKDV